MVRLRGKAEWFRRAMFRGFTVNTLSTWREKKKGINTEKSGTT